MRRTLAWFSAVAVTVGLVTVPPVAGAQITRSTSSFDTTCFIAAPNVAGVGGPMDITPKRPVQIHVTAPEAVDVGDRFDVAFEIDPINVELDSLPSAVDLKQASRLKLDLQRPAGTRLVGYKFTGGNIQTSDAKVMTVNEAGVPDANGRVLRLTNNGHHTIGNGGNASTNSHAGLGMNLAGKTSLDFAFPKVTLSFEAERAGAADIGVRTQGQAAGYGANGASFLTLLASASVPILGTQWVPGYCSPRPSVSSPIDQSAVSMKTVEIVGLPTSSTLAGPETVYLRTPAEFVTTVEPNIPGEVTFISGSQRVTVPVQSGRASAELTFTEQPSGPVRSIFTPTDPRYATAVADLPVTVERIPGEMSLTAPATTDANTRTPVSVTLPDDARGTVTFTGGGQERVVDVRDGQAATSLTFSEVGAVEVEAVFTPSATSPYASATATASIVVEESSDTTLILNGLDQPGYVADPVTLEAVINPAEGTADPQGRVEFVAGTQSRTVNVVDGRASAEFSFGRAGDVQVTATYHPTGAEQSRASDAGTLEIIDAVVTSSELVGPTRVEPRTATPYTIRVSPAGASGTANIRIDGRLVSSDAAIVDGEGRVDLTFPPAAATDRTVTVEFTPSDPRVLRTHTVEHTVAVDAAAIDEDALTVTVEGPEESLAPGVPGGFRVEVTPDDEFASAETVNGYLTLTNNGEPVLDGKGEPVRVPVTRGVADLDITWTGNYPQSKFVEFIYHSEDGSERATGSITVTVIGDGDRTDGVTVAFAGQGGGDDGDKNNDNDDDKNDDDVAGSLGFGSLSGTGGLLGSLGG